MPVKIDKRVVRRSFSRAASTYDSYSGIQRYAARMLVDAVPQELVASPPVALDIGSGTGEILGLLADRFPASMVTAMDISQEMLKKSRLKGFKPTPYFVSGDLNHLPFWDKGFNLITSGLTYQWVTDLSGAFAEAFRVVEPGGLFLLSVMSEGTLKELNECFNKVTNGETELMDFVSVSSLKRVARAAGFEVTHAYEETIEREYDDLLGLLRALRGIGASMHRSVGDRGLGRGTRVKAAVPVYSKLFPAKGEVGVMATYNIAYLLLRRP